MKYSVDISNFLEEISSLSHSIVSLYFFALLTEEGFLFSPCIWNSAFKWLYLSFSPLPFSSFLSYLNILLKALCSYMKLAYSSCWTLSLFDFHFRLGSTPSSLLWFRRGIQEGNNCLVVAGRLVRQSLLARTLLRKGRSWIIISTLPPALVYIGFQLCEQIFG